VVIHQLTAIPPDASLRRFDREFELTNRLRTEGTDHLIAASRAAGARRFVAQSFGGWPYAREGGPVKTEEDPLDTSPPAPFRRTLDALRHLETAVVGAEGLEGLALRYGFFYGPGTSIGEGGPILDAVRRRRLPIVGGGGGIWSFVHVDDAARATVAASERGAPGVYNVADDEPAPVSEWLPALAEAVGAKPPRRVPAILGRLGAGEAAVVLMTQIPGASNAKAKRELGWQPAYSSWREGFRTGLAK
jgi:nucleoside-diphosphate-sugar epimerase